MVIELNPMCDKAYYNMAIAYEKSQDEKTAIVCYEKALEINPDDEKTLDALSIVYKHRPKSTRIKESKWD
jgi:tetratricopeptide (TPR) repeat protein